MTSVVIIKPGERLYQRVNVKRLEEAYAMVGLKAGEVDHGALMPLVDGGNVGVVVYEFAFMVPASEQSYFSLNGQLFAGPAVLYQVDGFGLTVDMGGSTIVTKFYDDAAHVEYLIGQSVLERPAIRVNGEVLWQWPEAPPPDMAERIANRGRRR
jgi:hypothetical protein